MSENECFTFFVSKYRVSMSYRNNRLSSKCWLIIANSELDDIINSPCIIDRQEGLQKIVCCVTCNIRSCNMWFDTSVKGIVHTLSAIEIYCSLVFLWWLVSGLSQLGHFTRMRTPHSIESLLLHDFACWIIEICSVTADAQGMDGDDPPMLNRVSIVHCL